MIESATYSVLLSGDLKSGFEPEQVVDAFARLFKLTPEKASNIVGKHFVVKREVELSVAKAYKEHLSAIGVDVRLKRDGGIGELELEPVQPPLSKDGVQVEPGEMICPKCDMKQAKAEECRGCGVFVDKVHKIQEREAEFADAEPAASTTGLAEEQAQAVAPGELPVTMKWLIASLVVAVLGALLWYVIA
ncbi:MAG: hypothetical protein GY785_21660 [Gammaproteobacteria bacterium]|nr:hypothetical protein [Gammaproteobacteria bacterium]